MTLLKEKQREVEDEEEDVGIYLMKLRKIKILENEIRSNILTSVNNSLSNALCADLS